jgi:tetraacyldisaccharide 4'-kinase
MINLEKHWYQRSYTWLIFLLLPLSWIFRFITSLRRFCYRIGLKKTIHFSVPVIVVGNITVGGTGKTPLVIALVTFLKSKGFHPGIVSRGVGGVKQLSPLLVNEKSNPAIVGDEAVLLTKKTHCPVMIGIDRVATVQALLKTFQCDVIIADDGLQHYRLGRAMEIAVIDGKRLFGNGCLLPAGPLRELPIRLKDVDEVVMHGNANCFTEMSHLMDATIHEKLNCMTMTLQGDTLLTVAGDSQQSLTDKKQQLLSELSDQTVHAVAGIGHPERFFNLLRSQGLHLIEHVFPDHYLYEKKDFDFSDDRIIVMTEKDAVKCGSIADNRFWYLPVEATLDPLLQESVLKKLHYQRSSSSCALLSG